MITLSVGALDIHWFLLPSKGCVENATKEYMSWKINDSKNSNGLEILITMF